MRNMTRVARPRTIDAPFDGATLRIGSDTATMEMREGKRVCHARIDRETVVTRTGSRRSIGGRYREDFVGVDVTTRRPGEGCRARAAGDLRVRDAVVALQGLLRDGEGAAGDVARRCGARRASPATTRCRSRRCSTTSSTVRACPSYQGKLSRSRAAVVAAVDARAARRAGPRARARRRDSRSSAALRRTRRSSFANVLRAATARRATQLRRRAPRRGRRRLRGLSRRRAEHAADPSVLPTFALQKPARASRRRRSARRRARSGSTAPARSATPCCSRATRGRGRAASARTNPGGSTTNSGEGRDFQLGGCANQMACTTCHDPHGEDRREAIAELATPAGNAVCASCHATLATAEGVTRAHAPRAGRRQRVHRLPHAEEEHGPRLRAVALPPDRIADRRAARAATGRSSARCATPTRPSSSSSTTMEQLVGQALRPRRASALYGDDLDATRSRDAARGKPHEQAVAIGVLGETRRRSATCPRSLRTSRTSIRWCATTRSTRSRSSTGAGPDRRRTTGLSDRAEIQRWMTP